MIKHKKAQEDDKNNLFSPKSSQSPNKDGGCYFVDNLGWTGEPNIPEVGYFCRRLIYSCALQSHDQNITFSLDPTSAVSQSGFFRDIYEYGTVGNYEDGIVLIPARCPKFQSLAVDKRHLSNLPKPLC